MTALMNGTFTIVGPQGGHRTISITDDLSWMRTPPAAGTRMVSAMLGSDNERLTGIAFVTPEGEIRVWQNYVARTDLVAATKYLLKHGIGREVELGKAYALISKKCWMCNRKLTNPASHHYGYGPDCAEKHGLPYDRKATPATAAA